MKYLLRLGIAVASVAVLGGAFTKIAIAAQFEQKEIDDQSKYIALAMPLASGHYKLLVLQQVSKARPCWSESGNAPVVVDPLLVNFDFTGICSRNADSNGYSIRVGGEDLGLKYRLAIEHQGSELLLIGQAAGGPTMVIARTHGMADGFQKFVMEPGWRFSRRAFKGKILGHVYFTNDSYSAATNGSMASSGSIPAPVAPSPPVEIPNPTAPAVPATPVVIPPPVASEPPAATPVEPAPMPAEPEPAPLPAVPQPPTPPSPTVQAQPQPGNTPIQLKRRGPR
jgi:Protein of unknown function (DUF3747)